jgi:hypothetical protein
MFRVLAVNRLVPMVKRVVNWLRAITDVVLYLMPRVATIIFIVVPTDINVILNTVAV